MPRLLCLAALVLPAVSAAADEAAPVQLSVKPVLCIVDQRTPSCSLTFLVSWRSEKPGYYCVSSDLDERPLRCWIERRTGDLADPRDVAQDFSYLISEGTDAEALDSVTVQVVQVDSEDRRRRRRARHVWDLL